MTPGDLATRADIDAIVAELRQSCRLWNLPAALSRHRLRGRREPALS